MKKVSILAFILFAFLLYYFFIFQNEKSVTTSKLSGEEKNQAFKKILGRSAKEATQKDTTWKEYKGEYFFLSYPSYATVYERKNENVDNNKTILEHFRIDTFEPRFMFVAQALKLDIKNLDEFSAVVLRRRQKNLYEETQSTVGGKLAITFVKKDDKAEKATFISDEELIYSFVTTASHFSEAEEVYDKIMSSLKF